jgi:hypothetical protein
MKKPSLSFLLLIVTTVLYGQEIKISFAPTFNNAFYYQFVAGGPSFKSKLGFNSTIDFLLYSNNKISFGVGLDFQYSSIEIIPEPNMPPNDRPRHTEKIDLFSFYLRSVYNFRNGLYISLAPTADLHTNYRSIKNYIFQTIDNQSGLGLTCGFGKNFKLTDSLFLNIEPRLWIHNIIPFHDENLPLRLTTVGLNFGIIFGHKVD